MDLRYIYRQSKVDRGRDETDVFPSHEGYFGMNDCFVIYNYVRRTPSIIGE